MKYIFVVIYNCFMNTSRTSDILSHSVQVLLI